MATDKRNKTAELLDDLHEGVKRLTDSDEWARYLDVAARFHDYSPNNRLLIWLQRPDATHVAGYKTWQSMGRQVQKGESGIAILAPRKGKCWECDGEGRIDGSACIKCGGSGRFLYFTTAYVFDVSQTEGEPLPEVAHRLHGAAPEGLLDALVSLIREEGFEFRVEVNDSCPSANGSTDWTDSTVRVNPDLSPLQTVKTTAHELAHVLLHDPESDDRPADRGVVEVEAESVAYLVLRHAGLESDEYSFGYVAGWASGDHEVIESTAERVAAAADNIVERAEVTETVTVAA